MKGFYGKSAAVMLAAAATLGASSAAFGAEPTQSELLQQIEALRAKVEALEAKQGATTQRLDSREVDATVDSVLRDADARSRFLQAQGFTAGYSKGKFLIQSEDGNFVLNPNAQFQFRYVANSRSDAKNGDDDDAVESGFEARRLKFAFDGKVYGNIDYKFQWSTSRTAGTPSLDEGWARYHFGKTPWAIRAGTFVADWDHETGISSKRQLAVERSFLHEAIAGGATGSENYLQGVQLQYDSEHLRATIAYTDGFATRNTGFTDTGGGSAFLGLTNPQWGVFGRVDYKAFGDWKQYDDFTALKNTKDLLVFGAGFEYDGASNVNALFHTIDVQWEPQALKGVGLYAAFVGLQRDFRDSAGADGTPYDWGVLAQAAYALTDKWEVFARYDYTSFDDEAPTPTGSIGLAADANDKVHEFTGGVNYYLDGHNAKFTADVTWLPNGSPVNLDAAGILAQPEDEDQLVFRAQFQLLL